MSYLVLARKWRPQRFDEVIGQRHVSLTLANALKTGRLSHAYLFTGPRGVGKTSVARILAKALNCEHGPTAEPCNACGPCQAITEGHGLDVLEIDGASNRGIDDVRQLRESVKYTPSSMRTKVYIIDEVHMLTTDAFNALLKTLEEPPKHVSFIMATTEPLKVPPTIVSRCQRFDFGRVSSRDLQQHLRRIADAEDIEIDDEALLLLARKAEGGVRDSLTLLDQVVATGGGPFTAGDVQEVLGLSGTALCFDISEAIVSQDAAAAVRLLHQAYQGGLNLMEAAEELVRHFRNLLLVTLGRGLEEVIEVTPDEAARLQEQVRDLRPADALRWMRILLDVCGQMRRSAHPQFHLEVALAEMASLTRAVDLAEVLERMRSGAVPAGGDPQPRRKRPGPGSTSSGGPQRSASPAPSGNAEAAWDRVVQRVREEKAFLGSCLHESRVVGMSDGRLHIVLDDANGFKSGQVEKPANRRLILQLLEEAMGQPVGIRIVSGPAGERSKPQVRERPAPPPPGRSDEDGARRIARMVDGEIIGPAL